MESLLENPYTKEMSAASTLNEGWKAIEKHIIPKEQRAEAALLRKMYFSGAAKAMQLLVDCVNKGGSAEDGVKALKRIADELADYAAESIADVIARGFVNEILKAAMSPHPAATSNATSTSSADKRKILKADGTEQDLQTRHSLDDVRKMLNSERVEQVDLQNGYYLLIDTMASKKGMSLNMAATDVYFAARPYAQEPIYGDAVLAPLIDFAH